MSEKRFQRMEDKIDSVKADVMEVKLEVNELKSGIKHHMEKVEEHVAGDKKIINELQPVLSKLPQIVEMAEEYSFDKKVRKRKSENHKKFAKYLATAGMVVGLLTGLVKLGIVTF